VSPPCLTRVTYRFSVFEADPQAGELRKNGVRLRIQDQPFQILLRLLERPGQIVTREELKATLWSSDTFVDFDNGLNMAVKRLREALADDAERPIFIETVPRKGYRFIVRVQTVSPLSAHIAASKGPSSRRPRLRLVWTMLVIVLSSTLLVYLSSRPAPVPKVSNYVQLTHDGQMKSLIGTDGARLYLGVPIAFAYKSITQVSISGGEPTPIPAPSPDMFALNVSPDGSTLLVSDAQDSTTGAPLWSLPILGGPPRRLGATVGSAASWSPDGTMLAYSNGRDLFLAKADGTDSRKLVTTDGLVHNLIWSPNGSHLQFDALENPDVGPSSLREVSVDGTGLHRMLPGRRNSPDECCGRWTADGKYLVFQSNKQIWSLPRKRGGFLHSESKPIQLTSSPLSLTSPLPSKDGKKLFVTGQLHRGELMRYDSKSRQFSPFLGGISAEYVATSNDRHWVAYVTYPESTLWRSKPDGSERLQLTYSGFNPWLPRWSPDSNVIVFWDRNSERIFEISPHGGNPRQLIPEYPSPQWDPNWSPSGDKLVFSDAYTPDKQTALAIRILNLASHQVSTLPGSQGFFSPRWSPNGRFIVAMKYDSSTLVLFDFQTQKWTALGKSIFGWPNWSKDGQYVYVLDLRGKGAVLKIRIRDKNTELVADLKDFVSAGQAGNWLALAPDDSPLLLRNAGSQDVYALDWEAP
jgi:Tol biopolymer transport system component/DNA-binding winged helix-turn-helix (wHTH) protein